MAVSSKELEYYQTEYSKFWANQTKVYGFGKYERFLTRLIAHSNPTRVFEVGIGMRCCFILGKTGERDT